MGTADSTREACSCGAVVPLCDGSTHAYIGATPGCWRVYCDEVAREYGPDSDGLTRRLIVDAYAAHHPGVESRRATQSVAGHLIALHLVLERGSDAEFVTRVLGRAVEASDRFRWLEPPEFAGTVNVASMVGMVGAEDRRVAARAWAASVWGAWREHHDTVRGWVEWVVCRDQRADSATRTGTRLPQ